MVAGLKQRAVFLDLQGTLGGDSLGDVLGFTFYPCAIPAIRLVNQLGLLAIAVTNQSHIARGDFTLVDFERRMDALKALLGSGGARLDAVYCCPHSHQDDCGCRKPLPGMLLQAQRDHDLELPECYVVGDVGAWDLVMVHAVGCKAILVRTGLGEGSLGQYRREWANIEPEFVADDVLVVATWIASQEAQSDGRCDGEAIETDRGEVQLVQPVVSLREEFLAMADEHHAAGEERYKKVRQSSSDDFAEYVRRLDNASRGIGMRPGRVPQTTYWLVRGGTIIGESRLRSHLTPEWEFEGGHIGYNIRPSQRRRGYGTRLLALTLEKARELGIRRVLVTCDSDNVGSARVIQNNGGRFESEVVSKESGRPTSRYWIDLR